MSKTANRGRRRFGTLPEEQEVVQAIKLKARTRKGGKRPALYAVARELNAEGIRTQTGRPWTAQGVKNVLNRNEAYLGMKKKQRKKMQLEAGDYLSIEQLKRALSLLKGEDELIFRVLVFTGLRASEFCDLQVRDIGIFGGKSQIDVRRGKGARQRSIYIDPDLAERMGRYLEDHHRKSGKKAPVFTNSRGGRLTYDTLYNIVRKIGARIGIYGLHPHVLRHTFATVLYDYQKDVFFLKEQMGHSSTDTTNIYAKCLNEAKKEQMQGIAERFRSGKNGSGTSENTSKLEKPEQSIER